MANTGNSAVFFLGTRAHYQVLDQPEAYDPESGNTSTETLYQNASVEELWSKEVECDNNERPWAYEPDVNVNFENNTGVKKRFNRQSTEVLLCDNMQPALLNVQDNDLEKEKPRRTFLSFLSSLTRRKRRNDVQYLKHLENVLTTCTYRESCRCLECQSRYFEYESEEDCNSDDDYAYNYAVQDVEAQPMSDESSDDEVFVTYNPGDNTSTDLLIDDSETITVSETETEPEKQTQLEVAASTSAVLNVLLFHPACTVQ